LTEGRRESKKINSLR